MKSNVFYKKTRNNRIKKQVREVYLRDDIYCGASVCKTCDSSAARLTASTILVVDTNVVLNQVLDFTSFCCFWFTYLTVEDCGYDFSLFFF